MNDSTTGLTSSERVGSAILSRGAPRRGYGPRSAAPAGARDRDRARRPARPGRAAATALVVGLALLGAAAAEAQTPVTLVSNQGQTADDSASTNGNDHAQLFHTGAHAAGYTFTGMHVSSEDAEGDDFDVEICEEDGSADEFPSSTCTALTAPASFAAGLLFFDHTGLALSANTNYVVVIKQRGTGSVELNSTPSGGEDSTGLSDWSIKDTFYWNNSGTWTVKSGANEALRFLVYGYARTVGDATDATLSALSVSGATLSPTFAAATTLYHAVVANAVSQVTITETTSEATATVEYLDDSDATLTDADTMTAGLQVNLSVGSNIVNVKVTAPDTTTTETYTVNVLRVAVPVACSAASMTNRIWTGNLTVSRRTTGSTVVGYGAGYGSLDNTMFSFRGTAYSIDTVNVSAGAALSMALGSTVLGNDANDLILHVGTEPFALADALYTSSGNGYNWFTNVPTWADGDAACLALTADGPAVSSVALTSDPGTDNTYAIGDAVAATVTFSAAVDITGTPQLELDFAGTAKPAACTAATNTTTMVCEYEVAVGDSAPNGVAIAANTLTGGTIYATGSTTTSADLTHTAVAIDAGHTVDGIRPTLVTTGSDAPTTSTDGTQVILTFSEAISLVDQTKIDIGIGGGNIASTSAATVVAGTTVELDLSTFIDATVMLSVALAADAVEDNAENGNLALAETAVTNAIVPTPPGRPAAPSVSSVAGSTTSLLVTWTAPTNTGPAIDTYDLQYRQGTSGNFTPGPQNVSGTSETITGLTANTSYQVQVRATNSDGNSPWSPSGSGQTNTAGNSAPTFANPTETRSVAENSAAATNVGAAVTATDTDSGDTLTYTLEGTDASSFSIVSTSGQIRTRSGVTYDYEAQLSYTVTVKADDGNGGTDTVTVTINLTDDVDERPLAPAAPRVTATPDTTDSLTVSWSAPSNTGRPAIDDYDLQYREGTTGDFTPGPQNVSGTSATIAGLTAAPTAYQVQVRATNSDGDGPWSPPGRISRSGGGGGGGGGGTEAVRPPSPPRDLTATAGDQAVELSWRRPAENGGAQIVRYEYRQQEGDGPVGAWQIIGADPPPTTHRVTALTNGTSYTFQVRAVNNRHASPPSEPASATPEPELAPFEVTIVGVPEVAVAGASYELTAQSDAEEALVYAWRVAYGEGGSVEPTDTQTVVWTAPSGVNVAWIRVDATRGEDGATAGQSAYVRVEVPDQASLTLSAAPAPAEGGEPVTVTATLDNPAPADGTTVTLTTGGTATRDTDYTLSSTTITLAEGETAGTVTITVIDDAEDDDGETIVLDAASTSPALTADPLTLTIEDNDVTPVPALPLLWQMLLALGLTGAGARLLSRRPRVPPTA